MMTLRSFAVAAIVLAVAAGAAAAPGDVVTRIDMTPTCPAALAFDGKLLYYNVWSDPTATIYKMEAATRTPRGSITVKDNTGPIVTTGIEYDPNRNVLWVTYLGTVSAFLKSVSPDTGDILFSFPTFSGISIAIAYDPVRDVLHATDNIDSLTHSFFADGRTTPNGFGPWKDNGLAHDGVGVWHSTPNDLFPQVPTARNFFPTVNDAQIDFSRVISHGQQYWDIAYDCVTFPVPVLWATLGITCELVAIEVNPRAPCMQPSDKVLRLTPDSFRPPLTRTARLPLGTATATRVWRASSPLTFTDAADNILIDTNKALAFYAFVHADDTPVATTLYATKNRSKGAVVLRE